MCAFFKTLGKKPPCFRPFPREPSRARPPGSSHPQSGRRPTQGLACSGRFRDRHRLESVSGLDVFLRGAGDSDAVVRHVCARMFTRGRTAHLAYQPCVWAGRRRALGSRAAWTRIQSGAVRAPRGCWAPGSQSGTRCLCISSCIRLDKEPGTQCRNPKCVLLEPGAGPPPALECSLQAP